MAQTQSFRSVVVVITAVATVPDRGRRRHHVGRPGCTRRRGSRLSGRRRCQPRGRRGTADGGDVVGSSSPSDERETVIGLGSCIGASGSTRRSPGACCTAGSSGGPSTEEHEHHAGIPLWHRAARGNSPQDSMRFVRRTGNRSTGRGSTARRSRYGTSQPSPPVGAANRRSLPAAVPGARLAGCRTRARTDDEAFGDTPLREPVKQSVAHASSRSLLIGGPPRPVGGPESVVKKPWRIASPGRWS